MPGGPSSEPAPERSMCWVLKDGLEKHRAVDQIKDLLLTRHMHLTHPFSHPYRGADHKFQCESTKWHTLNLLEEFILQQV